MARMTLSVPDGLKDWARKRVADGSFKSVSQSLSDLVRRDRARQGEEIEKPIGIGYYGLW